jgi:DNA-binding MarR family transcriptional regulator
METIPLVMRFIRAEMRTQGLPSLSVPQFRTLMFLYRHPGSSLSSLAEHLGVTRPTASALTERLVQRGFVDRTEHPKERRQVALNLTDTGSAHLQQIRQRTRTKISQMFVSLSEAQQLQIVEGLAVLNDVFEETASEFGG